MMAVNSTFCLWSDTNIHEPPITQTICKHNKLLFFTTKSFTYICALWKKKKHQKNLVGYRKVYLNKMPI